MFVIKTLYTEGLRDFHLPFEYIEKKIQRTFPMYKFNISVNFDSLYVIIRLDFDKKTYHYFDMDDSINTYLFNLSDAFQNEVVNVLLKNHYAKTSYEIDMYVDVLDRTFVKLRNSTLDLLHFLFAFQGNDRYYDYCVSNFSKKYRDKFQNKVNVFAKIKEVLDVSFKKLLAN